ncbi:hypothetical protein A1O3_06210 [Capronia epimyces CBS 606.96]|uniref:C2H2-type domain-containing protein n=1 Tax=Capronia epimyces CBS 606.96 TaxID=1182542 RepID=W9XPF0_9EURO|nr:uncharacterized protein A1O3_06210 [Capronia epimyces CBS 606.96]EXJ82397.1 hypothetical protein A1O3_06210 [Capronia epimyces CBS 606.96]
MLPPVSMSSDGQTHDLQHLSFEDSSTNSGSFPLPPGSDGSSMASYSIATSAANPYTMYAQNQWFSYSNYPPTVPLLPYDPNSQTPFTSFPHPPTPHGLANIVPPTPRDNINHGMRMAFDFNTPSTTLPTNRHLIASPSFSQVSHRSSRSHRSSVPSLSRSCSPVQSVPDAAGRAHSREPATLRPPLRSTSTSSSNSLHTYGIPVGDRATMLNNPFSPTSSPAHQAGGGMMPSWRCAFPGCTSRATFTRGCDLRKHYNRHSKHLFCRIEGCPQSEGAATARANSNDQPLSGGFSSKKDRARHEAKHNPGIKCEWRGTNGQECTRVFSRMDNMKDHVRRIHNKVQPPRQQQQQELKQELKQEVKQEPQSASLGSGSGSVSSSGPRRR